MPGVASLNAHQYYAHPRNAFWPIMADIYGFDVKLPYESRIDKLVMSGVAVWDVLSECIRPGSLDSDIKTGSRVANDFATFFNKHPKISKIGFNGLEAHKSFNKYVLPDINSDEMSLIQLPSTSPAHTLRLDEKIRIWRDKLRA
ncbi:MAG: DNA-deoxyinosine glycosylase [Bacteroidota bacterium]